MGQKLLEEAKYHTRCLVFLYDKARWLLQTSTIIPDPQLHTTLSMKLGYHCSNTQAVSPEVFNVLSSQQTMTFPLLVPKELSPNYQSYATVPSLALGK